MARYRFTGEWRVKASPDAVFAALVDADAYPGWWPGVSTRRLDEQSGEIRLRSLLPLEVVFVATQEVMDEADGKLVARFSGDLAGTGRWQISGADHHTVARYDEEFEVRVALARAVGLLGRPVIRANHERMMRAGERGLRKHLEET